MKDLVIIGAGDFGREVSWVVERINVVKQQWNLLGFIDDGLVGNHQDMDGYPILGGTEWLMNRTEPIWTVCSIGTGATREKVINKISYNEKIQYATLIDPSVIVGRNAHVLEGSIVCAGTILAISTVIGEHSIINFNCTLGHDAELKSFCTVHPGCNISGKVLVGKATDIGTGSKIIQGKIIAPYCILGAGAVVARNLEEQGTYVGVPVKKIK